MRANQSPRKLAQDPRLFGLVLGWQQMINSITQGKWLETSISDSHINQANKTDLDQTFDSVPLFADVGNYPQTAKNQLAFNVARPDLVLRYSNYHLMRILCRVDAV